MRPFLYTTVIFFVAAAVCIAFILLNNTSGWYLFVISFIYLNLLVLGSINIQWNFYTYSFNKGKNRKWIALSFDDGPAAETSRILDILKEQNIQATFFCIGKNAAANIEIVKRWSEENHLIGNHSFYHSFHFDWQSAGKMQKEIEKTNLLIESITGAKPTFFRPPYGVTNPNLAKAIKRSQMYAIGWNVRSFDTATKDQQKLLARILRKVKGGDIILLHDSMSITADILTELITTLRSKGYSFVRLDQLLELKPYE